MTSHRKSRVSRRALLEAGLAGAAALSQGRHRPLIIPELAIVGCGADDALRDLAEANDGAQITCLASVAASSGLAMIAGFAESEGAHL